MHVIFLSVCLAVLMIGLKVKMNKRLRGNKFNS